MISQYHCLGCSDLKAREGWHMYQMDIYTDSKSYFNESHHVTPGNSINNYIIEVVQQICIPADDKIVFNTTYCQLKLYHQYSMHHILSTDVIPPVLYTSHIVS